MQKKSKKSIRKTGQHLLTGKKLGWRESNPRIMESKSNALPLGDSPIYFSVSIISVSITILIYKNIKTWANFCEKHSSAVCADIGAWIEYAAQKE